MAALTMRFIGHLMAIMFKISKKDKELTKERNADKELQIFPEKPKTCFPFQQTKASCIQE